MYSSASEHKYIESRGRLERGSRSEAHACTGCDPSAAGVSVPPTGCLQLAANPPVGRQLHRSCSCVFLHRSRTPCEYKLISYLFEITCYVSLPQDAFLLAWRETSGERAPPPRSRTACSIVSHQRLFSRSFGGFHHINSIWFDCRSQLSF